MESKVKMFGHPVHPMLIVFPIGLLATAVVFDLIFLAIQNPVFATVSYYMISAGILGGLVAAIFGLIDWMGLDQNSRAKKLGLWHGIGNVVIVGLFALSWFMRRGDPNLVPSTLALILSFLGVGLALVTAWIGGELVYRLGVGVDPNANVNAPSSLNNKPAPVSRVKLADK